MSAPLSIVRALLVVSLSAGVLDAQPAPAATPADVERVTGPGWTGTLTYRDYSSGERTTIASAQQLTRLAGTGPDARWEWRVTYPREPQANGADTVTLSADGRRFRGAEVTSREVLPDGTVQLVTETDGRDNDRPARLRIVYRFGARAASMQKLVRYAGGDFFERNIYAWTR